MHDIQNELCFPLTIKFDKWIIKIVINIEFWL